jgi:hypothetical protein
VEVDVPMLNSRFKRKYFKPQDKTLVRITNTATTDTTDQ